MGGQGGSQRQADPGPGSACKREAQGRQQAGARRQIGKDRRRADAAGAAGQRHKQGGFHRHQREDGIDDAAIGEQRAHGSSAPGSATWRRVRERPQATSPAMMGMLTPIASSGATGRPATESALAP